MQHRASQFWFSTLCTSCIHTQGAHMIFRHQVFTCFWQTGEHFQTGHINQNSVSKCHVNFSVPWSSSWHWNWLGNAPAARFEPDLVHGLFCTALGPDAGVAHVPTGCSQVRPWLDPRLFYTPALLKDIIWAGVGLEFYKGPAIWGIISYFPDSMRPGTRETRFDNLTIQNASGDFRNASWERWNPPPAKQ